MVQFLIILTVFLSCSDAYASGAMVARKRQMEAMQQQMQEEMMKQAIQERQQAEIQAYQQALAEQAMAEQVMAVQQQAQMQQAAQYVQMQQAAQMVQMQQAAQMVQQVQMQQAVQQQAMVELQNRRVNQVSDQRDVMIAKTIVEARNQQMAQAYAGAVQHAAVGQAVAQQQAMTQAAAMQQAQALQAGRMAQQGQAAALGRPYEQVAPSDVKDVVDISEVWKHLEKDSRVWALLIDNQAKSLTTGEFIDRFRKEGVKIQRSPTEYAHTLDEMASQNPQMLLQPFKDLVRMMAVMEYDFDNGMDRDALAKKVLGEKFYLANKKRLGM